VMADGNAVVSDVTPSDKTPADPGEVPITWS